MISTGSILLFAVQIFLFLDSFSVQSASIDRTPENSGITSNGRQTPSQRSDYKENLFPGREDSVRQDGNDSFSKYDNTNSPSLTNPLRLNTTVVPVNELNSEESEIRRRRFATLPPNRSRSGRSYISRSARKCMEYRSIDPVSPYGTCPVVDIPPNSNFGSTTVAGGTSPKNYTFSHVVALGRQNEDNEFVLQCGGTLIAACWVLTAAHCTHGSGGGIKTALFGIRHLNDAGGVAIPIHRTIRHPSYKPPALYADIALLQLKKPVGFSRTIKPACLQQPFHNIPESAWVSGWGATEFGGDESNGLQEAQLDILDNQECAKRHNRSVPVPNGIRFSMICAGAPNNNWEQDTCQGDSGGPLQIVHASGPCLYQVIGITSFGSGCAFINSPGVYTRVSHYLDWIENIVWPLGS